MMALVQAWLTSEDLSPKGKFTSGRKGNAMQDLRYFENKNTAGGWIRILAALGVAVLYAFLANASF
jgi:hypothetical protein